VSQPHFGAKCEKVTQTPKSGKMESSGTPKNSEDDLRGQISLPWNVLYINGNLLKCRCPKWARIAHLDICSPSYGQKKGRESNCQFDSRPLKIGNRPLPDIASKSATRRWKALNESYNFGSELVPIRARGEELWPSKVLGLQPGTVSGLQLGSLGKKRPFGCSLGEELQRILYGGRWWLPLILTSGESSTPSCPWLVPTPKGVPECELTPLWLVLDADSCLIF
jgi:hypothetical protein